MDLLILGLNFIAIIIHLAVVYYSYVLFKMVKPLKFWTRAWGVFTVGNILISLRRMLSAYEILVGGCPSELTNRHLMELSLLIIISGLFLCFSYKLEHLFKKYLNGEGVLLEREQVIESREKSAQVRESVVGKREAEVQKREDDQKRSGYYKDWKKDLEKK